MIEVARGVIIAALILGGLSMAVLGWLTPKSIGTTNSITNSIGFVSLIALVALFLV